MHIHISYISPKVPEVYQTEHVPDAINISPSPQAIRADKWIHVLGVWDSFSILSLPNQSLQPPLCSWSIFFFVFIILSLLLTHCHCLYWGHQSEVKTASLLAFILALLPIHTPPPDDCQWSSYNGHFRWHCNSSRFWPALPPVLLLFPWLFLYLCVTQLKSISHTVHSLWCPCLDFHPHFYLLAWLPRV